MTEGILRMYSMLFGGAGGDPDAPEDDEDIVDMVEGNLEDDMEQRNEENMRRLARQQEEVSELWEQKNNSRISFPLRRPLVFCCLSLVDRIFKKNESLT